MSNPDRLPTLGLPLSTGQKSEKDDKYKPIDRHGRTK